MPTDFAALTQAVAGQPDVEACLVVSRDGLVLSAWPPDGEAGAREVWAQLAGLGEVERGFVAVRDAVWAFCRRGPYGALAVASPGARPGLILDHLERLLLAAEEARAREGSRQGTEREALGPRPERRLRTALHREVRWAERAGPPAQGGEGTGQVEAEAGEGRLSAWASLRPGREAGAADAGTATPREAQAEPEVAPSRPGQPGAEPEGGSVEEDVWVDRVELAREFRGLLSEERPEGEEGP
jgi:hypothetical protein